jgi:hypothetical protein
MDNPLLPAELYNNLPSLLQEVTENFEGRQKDLVFLSTLGVLSNCLPNVHGLYDGKKVYTHLFLLIVAPPASGKGAMLYSRVLIEAIHKEVLLKSIGIREQCIKEKRQRREKDFFNCPSLEVKIIPANSSSVEIYRYLSVSEHGVLMIESEMDTISKMLKDGWSDYSNLLRMVFHNEPISISRKTDGVYLEIDNPKMALVLSGTLNQVTPFLLSKENGLFSRFLIYTFDEIMQFKNVFAAKTNDYLKGFTNYADTIFNLYHQLEGKNIQFRLSERQQEIFLKECSHLQNVIINTKIDLNYLSSLRRHGLILFKIAMILSILRKRDNLEDIEEIICDDIDFEIALNLVKIALKHAIVVGSKIVDGYLTEEDENILFSLPQFFTRAQALMIATKLNIPERTLDDKLRQWRNKKAILKIGHGKYKRTLT